MSFSLHRVAIVGAAGVGKSSLAVQFLRNSCEAEYDPTTEDAFRKHVCVDGEQCYLDILDTGQDEYLGVRDQYLRAAQGFLLVFSQSHATSLEEVEALREQICRVKDSPSPPMVLVDNRTKENTLDSSDEKAKKFADDFGLPLVVASSNLGIDVDLAFHTLVREIRVKQTQSESESCSEMVQAFFRRGCRMTSNLFNSSQSTVEDTIGATGCCILQRGRKKSTRDDAGDDH